MGWAYIALNNKVKVLDSNVGVHVCVYITTSSSAWQQDDASTYVPYMGYFPGVKYSLMLTSKSIGNIHDLREYIYGVLARDWPSSHIHSIETGKYPPI